MQLPGDPRIVTSRLVLRLVRGDDLPALLKANGDPLVTRYLPYETWAGPEEAVAWYGRTQDRFSRGEALQFVLERLADGEVIGSALLFHFDEGAATGEVGYLLAREHWGQGYMLEAIEALVPFARDTLGLRELQAVIETANVASSKLVARLGFLPSGSQDGLDTWRLDIR
jgi:[ribosomal protein S5]-alanine N-acetyltransferase